MSALVCAVALWSAGCKGSDESEKTAQPAPTTATKKDDPTVKKDDPAVKKDDPAAKKDDPAAKKDDPAAKPAPVTPKPGTVRVAILHDEELLGSEARGVEKLKKHLGKTKGITLDFGPASDEEKAAWQAYAKVGAVPASVPAPWQGFETVIALRVLPPRVKKSKRYGRGLGGTLILRPPSAEPVYREVVEGAIGASFSGDGLGNWLQGFLAIPASPTSPSTGKGS